MIADEEIGVGIIGPGGVGAIDGDDAMGTGQVAEGAAVAENLSPVGELHDAGAGIANI